MAILIWPQYEIALFHAPSCYSVQQLVSPWTRHLLIRTVLGGISHLLGLCEGRGPTKPPMASLCTVLPILFHTPHLYLAQSFALTLTCNLLIMVNLRQFFYLRSPSAPTSIVVVQCDRLSVRPSVCTHFLRISSIGLKFGGVMNSTMKQIAILNGRALPIFVCFTELWTFLW